VTTPSARPMSSGRYSGTPAWGFSDAVVSRGRSLHPGMLRSTFPLQAGLAPDCDVLHLCDGNECYHLERIPRLAVALRGGVSSRTGINLSMLLAGSNGQTWTASFKLA